MSPTDDIPLILHKTFCYVLEEAETIPRLLKQIIKPFSEQSQDNFTNLNFKRRQFTRMKGPVLRWKATQFSWEIRAILIKELLAPTGLALLDYIFKRSGPTIVTGEKMRGKVNLNIFHIYIHTYILPKSSSNIRLKNTCMEFQKHKRFFHRSVIGVSLNEQEVKISHSLVK